MGDPRYINHEAACFCLVSPLETQEEEKQQEQQQEERCLMVMANPSDLWPW